MKMSRLLAVMAMAIAFSGCGEKSSPNFPVSSVALNKTSTTIILGLEDSETLTATIEPNNATNKGVIWSSNNTSVAIVDQEGHVSAIAEGVAVITVTTLDSYYTASCTVQIGSITGTPNIIMTTESASISLALQGFSTALIDWGDGTHDVYAPPALTEFSHAYSGSLSRTIAIFGTNIIWLACNDNQLKELDVSGSATLRRLQCHNNQLTSLDVRGLTALMELDCSHNQLTSLDVSGCAALAALDCSHNQLTSLDVRGLTALVELYCSHNQLTSLDVNGYAALAALDCSHNQLTSLDVSRCAALAALDCSHNQLTSLDVHRYAALAALDCSHNQLTSLDVRRRGLLVAIDCSYNQLTELDMTESRSLIMLNCRYNYMNANALNVLFLSMPFTWERNKVIFIGYNGPNYDGSGTAGCNRHIIHASGYSIDYSWTILD